MTNHIIHKANFDIQLQNVKNYDGLQNEMAEIFNMELKTELEKLLDDFDTGNHIFIDKLNIELNFDNLNWKQELATQIAKSFQTELNHADKKIQLRTEPFNTVKNELSVKKTGSLEQKDILHPQYIDELLEIQYFLQTGKYRYYLLEQNIEINSWFINWCKDKELKDQLLFFSFLNNNSNALKRFVFSVNEETFKEVFGLLLGEFISQNLYNKMETLINKNPITKVSFYQLVLNTVLPLFEHGQLNKPDLIEKLKTEINAFISNNSNTEKQFGSEDQIEIRIENAAHQKTDEMVGIAFREGQVADYFINNAGLVLLHPFIIPFLENCELIKEGKWKNEIAQLQAPFVIQYLTGKINNISEEELTLNKIMCGINTHEPIIFSASEAKNINQNAVELLKAVISHWTVLKNTSIEGLQESFILRDGKILEKNGKWQLLVERKGTDVLLQSLPWSIGLVKNSLMLEMLHVEW